MNKIPTEVENPYDALLLWISSKLLPAMYATGSGRFVCTQIVPYIDTLPI